MYLQQSNPDGNQTGMQKRQRNNLNEIIKASFLIYVYTNSFQLIFWVSPTTGKWNFFRMMIVKGAVNSATFQLKLLQHRNRTFFKLQKQSLDFQFLLIFVIFPTHVLFDYFALVFETQIRIMMLQSKIAFVDLRNTIFLKQCPKSKGKVKQRPTKR